MDSKKIEKKVCNSKKSISFVLHLAEQIESCFYVRAFEN